MSKQKLTLVSILAVFTLLFAFGAALAENTASSPESVGGVTPYTIPGTGGGNVTCEQLGYDYSSGRIDYNGDFKAAFPDGITVEVEGGIYVSWTSTFPIGAVIVKGGNEANIYEYIPPSKGDSGLAAPPNDSGNPAGLSNLTFCWNAIPLEVEKDAYGTYDRTITWELVKDVYPDSHYGYAGDTFESTWYVTATKTVVEHNYMVTGYITITNWNPFPVGFTVEDVLDDDTEAEVECPTYTVPAKDNVTCQYTAMPVGKAGTNTVNVTSLDPKVGDGTDTAVIDWAKNVIGDESVVVDDDRNPDDFPATIDDSETWDYDEPFSCSDIAADYSNGYLLDNYSNLATLKGEDTDLEAEAAVTVTCELLPLQAEKDADGTYDRTITWKLEKDVDPDSHYGYAGDTFESTWYVTATKTVVEDNYMVTGYITITNLAKIPVPFTIDDVLDDDTEAEVECQTYTVPALETVVCEYTATPRDGGAERNIATVYGDGNAPVIAEASVSFKAKVIGYDEGTLSDPRFEFEEEINETTEIDFSETFYCPVDESEYVDGIYEFPVVVNWAYLNGNINLSASAEVDVTCIWPCEWVGETAWAAGPRYNQRGGNWATYTPYVPDSTVNLYAGQTLLAGTVYFSAADKGYVTITIKLNPGWRFEDVAENVKIQGYDEAPSGNPAPGQFEYKGDATGNEFTITVPEYNFYGVHVEVEQEVCQAGFASDMTSTTAKNGMLTVFLPLTLSR